MSILYKRVEVDEVTPVEAVGVYTLRWKPEWGEPTYAFTRDEETENELVALREALEKIFLIEKEGFPTAITQIDDIIRTALGEHWRSK